MLRDEYVFNFSPSIYFKQFIPSCFSGPFYTELHLCLIVHRRFGWDDTFHSLNNVMTHGKWETHVFYYYFVYSGLVFHAPTSATHIHTLQYINDRLKSHLARTYAMPNTEHTFIWAFIRLLAGEGRALRKSKHETKSPRQRQLSAVDFSGSSQHHWHQFVKLYLVSCGSFVGIRTWFVIIVGTRML